MAPLKGEVPQTDWPIIQIGEQRLIMRWTFYVQWLLSKRRVPIKGMVEALKERRPELVDTILECFAAAVSENYTAVGTPAPEAEYWARAISADPDPGKWSEICSKLFEAVGKVKPVATTPETLPAPNPVPLN